MQTSSPSKITTEQNSELVVLDWGLIDYKSALNQQLDLVQSLIQNQSQPGFIIFCTHPPIVTLGRQTKSDDITTWDGEILEISRGGRATYHGPSQIVVYVIMNLKSARKNRGTQEIRGFIRDFESAIVESLKAFGIESFGRSQEHIDDTGVWTNSNGDIKKLASIGIAVKNWISYHGAAINVIDDPKAFSGINPCGYSKEKMTSLEEILKAKIDESLLKSKLIKELQTVL